MSGAGPHDILGVIPRPLSQDPKELFKPRDDGIGFAFGEDHCIGHIWVEKLPQVVQISDSSEIIGGL